INKSLRSVSLAASFKRATLRFAGSRGAGSAHFDSPRTVRRQSLVGGQREQAQVAAGKISFFISAEPAENSSTSLVPSEGNKSHHRRPLPSLGAQRNFGFEKTVKFELLLNRRRLRLHTKS